MKIYTDDTGATASFGTGPSRLLRSNDDKYRTDEIATRSRIIFVLHKALRYS
jgi:hypothetical protein